MLRFTFSLLLILGVFGLSAQVEDLNQIYANPQGGDSRPANMKELRALKNQEQKDWSLQYIKLSYDVMPTGRWMLKRQQQGQEFQAAAKLYKYSAIVEYGFQNITRERSAYYYNSKGNFYRIGAEVNLLKPEEQNGELTFGMRFAQSSFQDKLNFTKDMGFGETNFNYTNTNGSMIWAEFTAGLNMIVWKNLHMGYLIRYKVWRNIWGINTLKPFDVPGFGRYENESTLQFNYYVGWAIPFSKKLKKPTS